jgi:hypothetical protein
MSSQRLEIEPKLSLRQEMAARSAKELLAQRDGW